MIVEKTTVEMLVTINDGIKGDRTLDTMEQFLRVDIIKGRPPKCQVLFDRRVVHRMRESKPLGYITYSSSMDVFKLTANIMASGVAMVLAERKERDVVKTVESMLQLQTEEVIMMVKAYLRALEEER